MVKKLAIFLSVAATLGAVQAQNQTQIPAHSGNPTPTFRINVVSRTTPAVSYRHRSGATEINFLGTDLMPAAGGEAKVEASVQRWKSKSNFPGWTGPRALTTSI